MPLVLLLYLGKYANAAVGKNLFFKKGTGVIDAAGGSGHVSLGLGQYGIRSTVVDPRPNVGKLVRTTIYAAGVCALHLDAVPWPWSSRARTQKSGKRDAIPIRTTTVTHIQLKIGGEWQVSKRYFDLIWILFGVHKVVVCFCVKKLPCGAFCNPPLTASF